MFCYNYRSVDYNYDLDPCSVSINFLMRSFIATAPMFIIVISSIFLSISLACVVVELFTFSDSLTDDYS